MWRVFVLSLFVIVCALDQNNQSEWKSADLFAQQTEPFDAKLPQGIVSIVKYFGSVQFFNNSRLGSKFFDAIHDYYGITTRGRISTVELPGNPCIHDNFVIAVASQPDTYITVLLSDQIRHSCKVDNSTRTVLQFISDEDIVNASFHIGATAEVDNTFSSNMTRADVFMMLNTVTAAILYHKSQTFLPGPAKKIKSDMGSRLRRSLNL
ncbi:unnamed protein product [Toxocara canis]|uniref:Secreted protein n=1 Tax=Toxocara canis TaxID=6265 RepID=A0A183TZD6_TOXCA|nr:unnamed protein product [Toxocara canis]